jgi:surface protein
MNVQYSAIEKVFGLLTSISLKIKKVSILLYKVMVFIKHTFAILLTTLIFGALKAQDFYLNENGVTIHCESASIGESQDILGITYTKRSKGQITTENSSTTCTSGIENMDGLFENDTSFNEDISHWDVSNVKSMNGMFFGAESFNQNINYWDVSNVEGMNHMFAVAKSFDQPLSDWDVSSVKTMNSMFASTNFNQDISGWNLESNLTTDAMFAFNTEFNQDISSWNVSSVENMQIMFEGAISFNQPLNEWNVSSVTNMRGMFNGASSFNQPLDMWDVSKVVDMSQMFYRSTFNGDISDWNTEKVINMHSMFNQSAFNQDISNWDVSSVTSMSSMFFGADFDQPIGNWNVSNVTNMTEMFAVSNFNQSLTNWDVSNVESMFRMFEDNNKFNQSIGNWNVNSVTNMDRMFSNAVSYNQDLSNWCVSEITSEPDAFSDNSPLTDDNKPIWGTCPEVQGTNEIPSYIPTDSLVAWYPFNGNANDESGNGNNGTVNGASLTTDKDDNENSAYSFDGVDDYIEISDYSEQFEQIISEITISSWFKDTKNDYGAIIARRNFTSNPTGERHHFELFVGPNNILGYSSYNNVDLSKYNIQITSDENVFEDNVWNNLIIRFNSNDNGQLKIYLNGKLMLEQEFPNQVLSPNQHWINIGRIHRANGNPFFSEFKGQIDDIAIWNRALTEEEIQAVYNQGAVEPPMSAIHTYVPNQTVFSIDTTFTSVYLENVPDEGFNAFQYTLNYDPDSLNVELIDNMGTLSEGFDLGINKLNPGQIIVAGSRVDPVTENGRLSNLKISYNTGGISHITLDDVIFNEGVPAATTDDARIESTLLVCGDVTSDNGVSALDASHILRHTVRLAPQYPLEGRDFIAGDVTSNGAVTAYDAYFVLREIVGLSAGLNCSSTVYNLKEALAPKLYWSILTKGSRIVTPLYFIEDTPEIYALEVEVPNSMEVSVAGIPEDWNTLEYTNEDTQYISMYGLSPLTTTELVWNSIKGGMVEARLRINESEWQTIEQELEVNQVLPQEYTLSQNYPNPFNPSTQIQFALPEATQVTLEVFNSVGQKVMELVNGQKSAGLHTATFDASGLSSGVYLYKLTTPSFTETKKMLLIK